MLCKTAFLGLLAGVAAAIPAEEYMLAERSAAATQNKMTLVPKVHPDVDRADPNCLKAQHDTKMHFDSDPNPAVDSTIATINAPGAPHPIVLLENSQYIKSVECTTDQAHIAFSNQTAFAAAVADWSQHPQFIMISYSPSCGQGFNNSQRDYAVVQKITPDAGAMIVDADIQFVRYVEAIGNETMIHAAFGNYHAPVAKRYAVHKTLNLNWNEYPTNSLSDTQWGSGYQLLQSQTLDVICVGCGTEGKLQLEGEVDFSLLGGFDAAKLSLKGSMKGQVAIGLDARGVSRSIPIASTQLAQVPIGGVEIPDIISLGPQIDINVGANVDLKATGRLLLGAELAWDSVDVELGLSGDDTRKGAGLTPQITPKDAVQGTISATLDLHLPVSVGIGINILDGTWNKSLAVVDTPGFQLTAAASNEAGACTGVELSADVYNNVGVDILEVTTFGLASWTTQFWSTCLLGSTPTPTPSGPASTSIRPTYTTTLTKTRSTPKPTSTHSTPSAAPSSTASSRLQTYTTKKPSSQPAPYTTKTPKPPPSSSTHTTTSQTPQPPKPSSSSKPTPAKRVVRKQRRVA